MIAEGSEFHQHYFQLNVSNLDVVCDPNLYNYGQMRDYCNNFSCKFVGGGVYGVIGDCGDGGWTLSYVLVGLNKFHKGSIEINGELADQEKLQQFGCYVGQGIHVKGNWGFRKNEGVAKLLSQGIDSGKCPLGSVYEIVEMFSLSKERLSKSIQQYSGERWRASIAIGFAHGKRIYGFPWLNARWLEKYIVSMNGFDEILRILRKNGSIVLIPTSKPEILKGVADKLVSISTSIY